LFQRTIVNVTLPLCDHIRAQIAQSRSDVLPDRQTKCHDSLSDLGAE
jgi:hypothetical protein